MKTERRKWMVEKRKKTRDNDGKNETDRKGQKEKKVEGSIKRE